MAINLKKAGRHLAISFGIFLAGALAASAGFWGYSNSLKERLRGIKGDNARLTSQISDLTRESKDLEGKLASSQESARRLGDRVSELEKNYRILEDRYRRLKESIGSFISDFEGLDEAVTDFGERLRDAVQKVLGLSN